MVSRRKPHVPYASRCIAADRRGHRAGDGKHKRPQRPRGLQSALTERSRCPSAAPQIPTIVEIFLPSLAVVRPVVVLGRATWPRLALRLLGDALQLGLAPGFELGALRCLAGLLGLALLLLLGRTVGHELRPEVGGTADQLPLLIALRPGTRQAVAHLVLDALTDFGLDAAPLHRGHGWAHVARRLPVDALVFQAAVIDQRLDAVLA